MVLTADVHDRSGRLLLGAGVELQPKHLVIFRTWGVSEVSVDSDCPDRTSVTAFDDIAPDVVAAMEESLKPRFCHADLSHPAIRELLRLSALYRIRHGLS